MLKGMSMGTRCCSDQTKLTTTSPQGSQKKLKEAAVRVLNLQTRQLQLTVKYSSPWFIRSSSLMKRLVIHNLLEKGLRLAKRLDSFQTLFSLRATRAIQTISKRKPELVTMKILQANILILGGETLFCLHTQLFAT